MQEWLQISLILCTFGFLREFRPSEPFVTEFLSGEWRDITSEQLNREVYPVGTYSTLGLLVIVFLVTDILRYKPIIIASACSGIIIWSMLLWTTSLLSLQIVQFFYGFFMAAEVAYYTYMYAKVDKEKYQKVTGNARAAILAGRFLASLISQILVTFNWMDLRELNFLTLGAQIISLIIAVLLPSVGISLYFYAVPQSQDDNENTNESQKLSNLTPKFSYTKASTLLWKHFLDSYSNPKIVQWSLWWALAMAGFLMVQIYVQILWQEIDSEREFLFNAGVEAFLTLFGAIAAFLAGILTSKAFDKFDLWILTVCSLLEGIFIIISSQTDLIWVAYVMYVLFGILYSFMITIVSATVAKHLADDSFALIFGINTLGALVFQSILTAVVISWLNLSTRSQFLIYGCYFVVLSIIYLVTSLVRLVVQKKSNEYAIRD